MQARRTAQSILASGFARKASFQAKMTAFLATLSFLLISSSSAADYYWSVTSGDWSVASNWGGTVPTSGRTAYINNGGTASIAYTGAVCSYLYLGNSATDTGTINLTTGRLDTSTEDVGLSGKGAFTQSGGTHISDMLTLGMRSGSTGNYELSGEQLSANQEIVGYSGTGTFTQSGGSNTVGYQLLLGCQSGSTGNYELSGGQLSANWEHVGDSGTGTFTQSGGSHTIGGTLYLGRYAVSTGNYELSGGQLLAATEYVGSYGMGTFTQFAGVHSVSLLSIGSSGTYRLSGGTLNLNAGFDNQGVFDLTGSFATINAPSAIVNLAKGTFTNAQNVIFNLDSHSLLIVPSDFDIPSYFNLNGALVHQAGSTLTISPEQAICGEGTIDDYVECAGGALTATTDYGITLRSGVRVSSGTVNLGSSNLSINDVLSGISGGQLIAPTEYVGYSGMGTFTQSGGTHSIAGPLYLGNTSGSTGNYELSGGQLLANQEIVGYSGTGTFTQSGGSNTVGYQLLLGSQSGSTGNYELSGGQLSAAMENVGSYGTGTFTQSGGSNTVLYQLYLGSQSGSTGNYELSGGLLSAATEYVGNSGTGTFTQSGGSNTVLYQLYLGSQSGSTGNYELSDGQLSAATEYVGYSSSKGTFTQSGGSHTIGGTLYLGYSGSTGNYELSGGQLSAATEYVGSSSSKGTFTQSGGSHTISGTLYLGDSSGSTGNYELSGGQLSAAKEYVGSYSSKGTFTQSAGVHSVSLLSIGSSGTYRLSGGTLNLNAGFDNKGKFDVAESTATINACSAIVNLAKGTFTNAQNVIFNLDSHSLLIVPNGLNPATFFTTFNPNGALVHQAGSTLTISPEQAIYGVGTIDDYVECAGGALTATTGYSISLYSGVHVSNLGNVSLGTGDLYVNNVTSGISGGQLIASTEYVGYSGSGTFTQSGGTHTIGGTFYLGYSNISTGSYTLNGGQLLAATEYVGSYGMGTFTQFAGVHSVSLLSIGSSGTYRLSGGTLNLNAGFDNQGVFDLTGSFATINAPSAIVNLAKGTFTNAQNVIFNLDSHSLLIVPSDFDIPSYFNLNGALVHQAGSTLTISPEQAICGEGTIDDYVECAGGALTATTDYGITLRSGVRVSNLGNISLGTGDLYVNNVTSGINSSQLTVSNEYIGYSGTGTLTQSGGTNTIASSLYLGYASKTTGTYTLSGGSLSAQFQYIGSSGTGIFLNSGGDNVISRSLCLGLLSGSTGEYILSSTGTLNAKSISVGSSGVGRLVVLNRGLTTNSLSIGNKGTLGLGFDFNTGSLSSVLHASVSFSATAGLEVTNGATATQTSSSFTLGGLYLGSTYGSGSYQLDSGYQLTATNEYVGYSGNGTFWQSGGGNAPTNLYLGYNSGTTGTYTLQGGSLACTTSSIQYIGYSGTGFFTQTGGTYVGKYSGNMNFCLGCNAGSYGEGRQSGGLHTNADLLFGYSSGSSGVFYLEGGTLSAGWFETIGYYGTGIFNQTGGVNLGGTYFGLGHYRGGGYGTYNLSGNGYLSATYENITNGVFNQTGGTNFTNTLYIGDYLYRGVYNLDGGLLRVSAISQSYTYQFNFGGGTLQAGGTFSTSIDMNLTGTGGDAKVDTAGYNVTLSGVLSGEGGLEKRGAGTLILAGKNTYTGETSVDAGVLQIKNEFTSGDKISVADGAGIVFGTPYVPSTAPENDAGGAALSLDPPYALQNTAGQASSGTQNFSSGTLTTQGSEIAAVPEPGMWVLLAVSVLGGAAAVRKRRR